MGFADTQSTQANTDLPPSLRTPEPSSMWQRGFAQIAQRAARQTLRTQQRRGLSGNADAFAGHVQAGMAAFESQRSLQPRAPPPSAPVQPAKQQTKASAASSFMQVVFLGYGVGKFELELIRGSPQLSDVALRSEATKEQKMMLEAQAAEVAAKFDLSFVPPPSASAASGARSSWVTDQNASSSMDPAEVARAAARQNANKSQGSSPRPWEEELDPRGQMGDPAAPLNRPAAPRSSPAPAAAAKKISDRALPDAMHLIINSSVVVYQNCMVSEEERHTRTDGGSVRIRCSRSFIAVR